MKIRLCTEADIDAVNAIYNYEIENGVATFDTVIRSKDNAITWFNSHNTSNHPIFVAVDDNDKVLAYCSLSQYRDKDAFDTTVEISIYVDLLARRQGLQELYATILSPMLLWSVQIFTILSLSLLLVMRSL